MTDRDSQNRLSHRHCARPAASLNDGYVSSPVKQQRASVRRATYDDHPPATVHRIECPLGRKHRQANPGIAPLSGVPRFPPSSFIPRPIGRRALLSYTRDGRRGPEETSGSCLAHRTASTMVMRDIIPKGTPGNRAPDIQCHILFQTSAKHSPRAASEGVRENVQLPHTTKSVPDPRSFRILNSVSQITCTHGDSILPSDCPKIVRTSFSPGTTSLSPISRDQAEISQSVRRTDCPYDCAVSDSPMEGPAARALMGRCLAGIVAPDVSEGNTPMNFTVIGVQR
jgi:hypothetical protein